MSPRARVLALTWLSYASFYLCRKNVSVSKTALQGALGFTVDQLGWVETGYLAAYALGPFTLGALGDRLVPRRLLTLLRLRLHATSKPQAHHGLREGSPFGGPFFFSGIHCEPAYRRLP